MRIPALIFMLVATSAGGQGIDDAWVTQRVLAGRYQELRELEAEAQKGSVVATYWWGALLANCAYGACDIRKAEELFERAADGGHPLARFQMLASAPTGGHLNDLLAKYGDLQTTFERYAYAATLFRVANVPGNLSYPQALNVLRGLVMEDPSLLLMDLLTQYEDPDKDPKRHVEVLRAAVEAGHWRVAQRYRRALLHVNVSFAQSNSRAMSGDMPLAAAMCEDLPIRVGALTPVPPDVQAVCERALSEGYLNIAAVLLRHHVRQGDDAKAAYYADFCASLPDSVCLRELAEYHDRKRGSSQSWKLWDAVGRSMKRRFTDNDVREFGLSPEILQQVLTIRIRYTLTVRACGSRRYDAAAKRFEDDPACPYRKPIAIPSQFLGGKG